MRLTQAFQAKAHAEHLERDDWQRFGKDAEAIGPAMQQDPKRARAQ